MQYIFSLASINRDKMNDRPGHRDMLLKPGLSRSNRDEWQAFIILYNKCDIEYGG